MAVRVARSFAELRAEIRRVLKEPDPNNSGWNNDMIADAFNRNKDAREMDLQDTGEGISITIHKASLVANQPDYSIPPQGSRLRRVLRFIDSQSLYIPLEREELQVYNTYTGGSYSDEDYIPTYRRIDNHFILTPPPSNNITDGLRIEMESATSRITADNQALPDSWPHFGETLLIYDTAIELLDIEFAQSPPPEGLLSSLVATRAKYEQRWQKYISTLSFGPKFAQPLDVDRLS